MAITVGTSYTGTIDAGTEVVISSVVFSGTDAVIVVNTANKGGDDITSMIWDSAGVAEPFEEAFDHALEGTDAHAEMWLLKGGTQKTADVTITFSGSTRAVCTATIYTEVNTDVPFRIAAQSQATGITGSSGTPITTDVVAISGELVIDSVCQISAGPDAVISQSGTSIVNEVAIGGGTDTRGMSQYILSSGATETMSYTMADDNSWAITSAPLQPTAPVTVLNTADAFDFETDTTPTLEFTGTDVGDGDIQYNIKIDTVNTFDSQQVADPYDLKYVDIRFSRYGSPTDNVFVELRSNSPTGALLRTSDSIDGSSFVLWSESFAGDWVRFTFPTTYTLNSNTKYCFLVSREGAYDNVNYYFVNTSSGNDDPTGDFWSFKSSWAINYVNNDMSMRLFDDSVVQFYANDTANYRREILGVGGSTWTQKHAQVILKAFDYIPLINANSLDDVGFANTVTGGDTNPFNSGEKADYDVQSGDALTTDTYYWSVRAKAPTGMDTYGAWATTRSFDINEGGSTSPSVSPSVSESPSLSPSVSVSPSVSESPSVSPSVSESPSLSPSVSVSPSPSPGWENYTKEPNETLPTDDTDLASTYTGTEYTNVDTKNDVRVSGPATKVYSIHQFKDYVGAQTSVTLEWEGQSDQGCTISPVVLQLYNQNSTTWETVDSDSTTAADTDFTLTYVVGSLTNYKTASDTISCRVYQLNP